jgi:hypothetical protein
MRGFDRRAPRRAARQLPATFPLRGACAARARAPARCRPRRACHARCRAPGSLPRHGGDARKPSERGGWRRGGRPRGQGRRLGAAPPAPGLGPSAAAAGRPAASPGSTPQGPILHSCYALTGLSAGHNPSLHAWAALAAHRACTPQILPQRPATGLGPMPPPRLTPPQPQHPPHCMHGKRTERDSLQWRCGAHSVAQGAHGWVVGLCERRESLRGCQRECAGSGRGAQAVTGLSRGYGAVRMGACCRDGGGGAEHAAALGGCTARDTIWSGSSWVRLARGRRPAGGGAWGGGGKGRMGARRQGARGSAPARGAWERAGRGRVGGGGAVRAAGESAEYGGPATALVHEGARGGAVHSAQQQHATQPSQGHAATQGAGALAGQGLAWTAAADWAHQASHPQRVPVPQRAPKLPPQGCHGLVVAKATVLVAAAGSSYGGGAGLKGLGHGTRPPPEASALKRAHHGCGAPAGCPWA